MPNNQLYTISLYTIDPPESPSVLVRYWRDRIEVQDELVVELIGGAR